ncbi:MAG: hypothetical protein ACJAZX_000998 [Rickettsiales bacterium]
MTNRQEIWVDFNDAFQKAEISIKNCENLTGELPQGAVNELRYSCKHLIEFLKNDTQKTKDKFLSHCKRAEHDSKEIVIIILKKKIQGTIELFHQNEDVASELMGKDYSKILISKSESDKFLLEVTDKWDARDVYLDEIQKIIPTLTADLDLLDSYLPAITQRIKKEKKATHDRIFHQCLAVLAIIVAITIAVFTL